MSARVSAKRIQEVVKTLRELGLGDRGFDIRLDGVTVYPPNAAPESSAYDSWKKGTGGDGAAHRP